MLRLLGFGLVFMGCVGLGMWYSFRFRQEIHQLKTMCYVLKLLEGQISYGSNTMAVSCMEIAGRVEEPFKSCLSRIYHESCRNDGKTFGEVSTECFSQILKKVPVGEKEKQSFLNCFIHCGFEEERQQTGNIRQERADLEEHLQDLNKEIQSKCRLSVSLGTMGGILLVILFL
ncbi:MAG: stage III sporulation protein AB [Lachnospiraceae bacterium]|nr:stage III sporulation protein AB [Lachnospiraceae bacterium]